MIDVIGQVCCASDGMPLLLPLLFYSGISNAFWSGMFTRQMPTSLIGAAMCILGGGEIVGGIVIGKASPSRAADKVGQQQALGAEG